MDEVHVAHSPTLQSSRVARCLHELMKLDEGDWRATETPAFWARLLELALDGVVTPLDEGALRPASDR